MRSVPSNEHCGQYGGVGNREYVMVMVVMQSVAVLGNSTTDGGEKIRMGAEARVRAAF